MVEADQSSQMTVSTASGEATGVSSLGNQVTSLPVAPPKKKRNLPGMPDPDAEVIALSPKSLLATNRFVCEICSKGFQRDQNLQLHRRGHNLPWKLKQRETKEPRKRVYVCPEPSCVHHSPARALGDLTGIKKHFCRKHGEKKWKCERCSKKYAVQSDWKAHMKTCGTREYKCDCGTLFSRRDSFVTHRAFCEALAEESTRAQNVEILDRVGMNHNAKSTAVSSPPPQPLTPSTTVVSPGVSVQSSELAENPNGLSPPTPASTCFTARATSTSSSSPTSKVFASIFASSTTEATTIVSEQASPSSSPSFSNLLCGVIGSTTTIPTPRVMEPPPSLSLSPSPYLSNNVASLFSPNQEHHLYAPSPQPAMSATALLQKAAQMGATTSHQSFLRSLRLQDNYKHQWDVKPESSNAVNAGLGLGLHSDAAVNVALNQPATLDLLGLGMGASPALLNSYGGNFNVGPAGILAAAATSYDGGGGGGSSEETWDGVPERKGSLMSQPRFQSF
ncbi:hypothetical protein K2173_007509 [Erythroxylum novogranatense]|uniref:C2H2-type domain-containing protein n=1 Tax=Erythroxylum novogranatense TaxID=1862640 RepID=A0AAV8T6E0_9ROSI|nr:hypothetical protein K2173_007509 [Erythroxylum novogranatense]